jgi:hypothetical protein
LNGTDAVLAARQEPNRLGGTGRKRCGENAPKESPKAILRGKNARPALVACPVVNAKRSTTGAFTVAEFCTSKTGVPPILLFYQHFLMIAKPTSSKIQFYQFQMVQFFWIFQKNQKTIIFILNNSKNSLILSFSIPASFPYSSKICRTLSGVKSEKERTFSTSALLKQVRRNF